MASSKTTANYDEFPPNFVIAYKTIQRVSVPNFKVIWTNENIVTGQRSWRIFYYVISQNWLAGTLCLPTWLLQNKRNLRLDPGMAHQT